MDKRYSQFKNPGRGYRAKPFWAWNSELESDELCRQIRLFKEMGFGGFFMHSRIGLKTPYLGQKWFDVTRDCIAEAARTDMEAWLYDEDRWPSGPAGGLVTKDPSCRMKVLRVHRNPESIETIMSAAIQYWWFAVEFRDTEAVCYRKLSSASDELSAGEDRVAFTVEYSPGSSWFNGYTYLDTLSEDAVAEFIQSTHERYRQEVGEHFGKTVPGIFTDEPNHGPVFRECWGIVHSVPW
ncbi:MAG: hypothetical protein AB7E95_13575, partial [Kiritimatiellales bacterium]